MIQNNLQQETEIRRFLLGEMPEEERSVFESRFIEDEDLFEQIRIGEDELIEAYVRGTLNTNEKLKFEKNFLTTKTRRERVGFMRGMLEKLAQPTEAATAAPAAKKNDAVTSASPSVWETLTGWFVPSKSAPKYAWGAVFALILIAFAGWLFITSFNKQPPTIALQPTPTVSVTPVPEASANNQNLPTDSNINGPNRTPVNKNTGSENVNRNPNNKNSTEPPPRPMVASLALFTGGVRSSGATSELNISKDVTGVNLQLNLESQDYKVYRAEIVDQDGKVVYRSGNINSRSTKINTFVPAARLPHGDYIVKVYGKNAENKDESAADFTFRVNRK